MWFLLSKKKVFEHWQMGNGFFICQVMLCIALDYRVSETLCTLADLELALDQ
jgi:hypothetical protein